MLNLEEVVIEASLVLDRPRWTERKESTLGFWLGWIEDPRQP